MTGLGLKVNVAYEEDTSKADGIVLKQSLEGGKTVNEGTTVTITVNKVTKANEITVNIDLSKITNYKEMPNNQTNTTETNVAKTVDIKITVDGNTVHSDSGIAKSKANYTAKIQGKGNAEVKLVITDNQGGNWTRTQTVDFNNATSINFK